MPKKYFVSDLVNSVGLNDEDSFLIAKKERRSTKTGKPFMDLLLKDKSGSIKAKVWSDNLDNLGDSKVGDIVQVEFRVDEYRGDVGLVLRSMRRAQEYDPEDYVEVREGLDETELKKELSKHIDSVRDFQLRKLIDAFFEDEKFYQQFITSPAAMKVHHNYRHGLLQHTMEVLQFLQTFYTRYPEMNRDLLVTGGLLHDVGKVQELDLSEVGQITRSVEGRLLGHIGLSIEMLIDRIPEEFPSGLKTQVLHLIVSHHGKLKYGSPVTPATREAFALHYADLASTHLKIAQRVHEEGVESRDDEQDLFAEYSRHLETSMFIGDKL